MATTYDISVNNTAVAYRMASYMGYFSDVATRYAYGYGVRRCRIVYFDTSTVGCCASLDTLPWRPDIVALAYANASGDIVCWCYATSLQYDVLYVGVALYDWGNATCGYDTMQHSALHSVGVAYCSSLP